MTLERGDLTNWRKMVSYQTQGGGGGDLSKDFKRIESINHSDVLINGRGSSPKPKKQGPSILKIFGIPARVPEHDDDPPPASTTPNT